MVVSGLSANNACTSVSRYALQCPHAAITEDAAVSDICNGSILKLAWCVQTENTSTPEGWAKLEHAESGEGPNIMDEGELPVDANGNYVSGVPVDPEDPRTRNMKPAGKTSPPTQSAVRKLQSQALLNLRKKCMHEPDLLPSLTAALCAHREVCLLQMCVLAATYWDIVHVCLPPCLLLSMLQQNGAACRRC